MKRKTRCGDCDGCRTANCGSCLYCRDMIKFGGQGKMKQACTNRVCLTRSLEEAATKKNTKERKRNDRGNRSKGSHGCDQCEGQFHQKNDLEAHLLTHANQNPLKFTDDANSQDEKVKIEKNDVKGEMYSNHNLMAPSENMFINNNDCGVTKESMLEDGTDIENSPIVSILSEKAKVRISKKQFSKTEGISLSDVEMPLRGMTSENAVETNETGAGFNEVKNSVISLRCIDIPENEKKSEDIIKKNETKVKLDDVTVISDDDTDLTSKSLDRPYETKGFENYSGQVDECFIKVEVPKNVEVRKYQDDKAESKNNATKGCNSSQYISIHDPHEKNLNGDLMTKSGNSLDINNVAKISQQSVNEDQTTCNGSSKTSVITKKHSFETPEKKVTSKVASIDIVGKHERIKSENIRKNKTSIESTDTAVIGLDDDMDKSDQPKEECSKSYSRPILTNYSREEKEAQELVQDETARPEKVLTIKKQDNGIPRKSKHSTNKENIYNKSIFEVNGNLRIPAVTFVNTPKRHCEGDERENKIIETDNVYDTNREVAEMSESSTTSDEELIDQSEEEDHFDRHSNLNLSVPIPSFSHPLLSSTRSPAGPIPPTKCASQRGGEHMDRIAVEYTQENCDNAFEVMTTSDFESPPIDDRSIEDIFEDFIKRKSIYII